MINAVQTLEPAVGTASACRVVGLSRATFYRATRPVSRPEPRVPAPRKPQHRALSPEEKDKVIEVLHSERFIDSAPAEIVATLLDEGVYLCSERTMYRNLAEHNEVKPKFLT